ncbi:dermonecrotic toxin domain-containing protein [Pseudomonas gozinkensis]|uniref:dermonecrotic toxin domain-containing protein n=1 Tax=Pseudomonas gozinkensis TaxID=2774461 RepID=UPI00178815FB|nr:DUF6543 domain-containing protein [Pseudomonas gozinkensis]
MSVISKSSMVEAVLKNPDGRLALDEARRAGDELRMLLERSPSLRDVVRINLSERFVRLGRFFDVESLYIAAGDIKDDIHNRPSGSILDVFMQCLERGFYPAYIQGSDFVYSGPQTVDARSRIESIRITEVEAVLLQALQQVASYQASALRQYWSSPAHSESEESTSHKQLLETAFAEALRAELALTEVAGSLKSYQALRAAELLQARSPGGFKISLRSASGLTRDLVSGFVMSYSSIATSRIKLSGDAYGWFLYTPDNGFEYYSSSSDMHAGLCSRLAVAPDAITYPALSVSVFSHCVDSRLKDQEAQFAARIRSSEQRAEGFVRELENIQQVHAMHADLYQRIRALQTLVKRQEWPDWLKSASATVRNTYETLEASKEGYELEYVRVFDTLFSLRDFTVDRFGAWCESTLGMRLDPDAINVHSLYRINVGGRTIEQEDTRTLTEFIVIGLHDAANRATLRIEGAPADSGLTVTRLEGWLANRDLRVEFSRSLPHDTPQAFREAWYNYLHSQAEFALYVARHSARFSEADVELIKRTLQGDPSVEIRGVKLKYRPSILQNVLLFMPRTTKTRYALIKMPHGQFEWVKFADIFQFNRWLESMLSDNRAYAESLISPDELLAAGQLMGGGDTPLHYLYELDPVPGLIGLNTGEPLFSHGEVAYASEAARVRALAPAAYAYAGAQARQSYARLSTELRALSMVDSRENGYPTFEQFSRDLIKQRIEEVLLSRGQRVQVDPDKIMIQTDDFHLDLTTVLIEGRHFEVPATPGRSIDDNPRFYVTGVHPSIEKLDIRDLSSWSKTLRPGDHYTRFLQSEYLDRKHPGYEFKRAVHARKIRCEMHYDTCHQHYSGQLSLEVFRGIQRLLDNLEETAGNEGSPFPSNNAEGIYKFRLPGRRIVEGVYIFRISIYGKFHDYLYTPNAPDSVAIRSVDEFVGSIRLRFGPLREYYAARVKIEDWKVVNDYFDTLVATVNAVEPPQPEGAMRLSGLNMLHDDRIYRVLSDIDAQTTSLNEVIAGLVYDNVIFAANLISLVIPPVGVVVTAVEVFKSLYDGASAYELGDYQSALGHGKSALVGLVSLGKAAAAGKPVKVTPAQKTLFDLGKDARTVVGWMSQATGQKMGEKRLIEIIEQMMQDHQSRRSQTTVR